MKFDRTFALTEFHCTEKAKHGLSDTPSSTCQKILVLEDYSFNSRGKNAPAVFIVCLQTRCVPQIAPFSSAGPRSAWAGEFGPLAAGSVVQEVNVAIFIRRSSQKRAKVQRCGDCMGKFRKL